jgi:malonyl-CoA O-methyltransferase
LPNAILYDISLAMLKFRTNINNNSVNGMATQLPFIAQTFKLVISSLMIQWSREKEQVLKEVHRVLCQDGIFIVTTLIDKSLWQLESTWKKLDNYEHIINFATKDDYTRLVTVSGFEIIHLEEWEYTEYFKTLDALLRSFKLTGTSIPKSTCNRGLGGRDYLQQLDLAYPRIDNKLPLSYHNLLIVLKKTI